MKQRVKLSLYSTTLLAIMLVVWPLAVWASNPDKDSQANEPIQETINSPLETVNDYVVSGQVTDANTGWPLYTAIEIQGSPYTIWTDPVNGSYSVTLPADIEYTFHVTTWVAGYLPESRNVGPLTGNVTEDFALEADIVACVAPGYAPVVVLFDDFESGYDDWTMSGLWHGQSESDSCGSMVAPFPSPVNAAYYGNPDTCDFNVGLTVGLLSRIDPITIPSDATLSYWSYEETECNGSCTWDKRYVEASIDGGSTWTILGEGNTEGVWHQRAFDLTPYTGEDLHLRFRFDSIDHAGNAFFGWMVDDVAITAGCEPMAGSLVVGNVYDENSSEALSGATVSNDSGTTTITQATPDDPNVDDGFYTLFTPQGSNVLTATHTPVYGSDTITITIGDGATVGQNFWLPAGWLTADQADLSVFLLMGDSITINLALNNLGNLDADFQIIEIEDESNPTNESNPTLAGSGAINWLYRNTEGVPVEDADSGQTAAYPGAYRYAPAHTIAQESTVNILVYTDDWWHTTPNTYPEQAIAALGLPATIFVGGNYAGFESALNTGGPWDLVIWSGENFIIPSSTLTALLNYVNDGGALAATYWQQLAIPDHPLWAAMGFEYVANEVDALPAYWWEPDHAIFTSPEEAPEWIERFARSGVTQGTYIRPLDGSLLVAGYTTSPEEDQGNIVIGNDERTVYKGIRDLSTDADANGSGVPDAVELWQNIITGLLTGFTPNVPWLSEEPAAGTVAALDSQIIEVTFDAGVAEVTQPGEYLATLQIDNNTPYGPLNIPVTMTVVDEFIYDIVLETEMDTLSGAPGEIVDYTLHLTNTGNVPDTYTIDLSGYIWNSELTTASLSLLPGQSDSFTVSVEIPTGALAGDNDTVMVTATSAGDPGFSDAVTLTTIATAVYGLELTAEITAASGEPGEVAVYTLYLTNTANATDTFSLELSGYTWDSDLSPDSLALEAGESAAFTVSVDIPGDAMAGDSDVVTATVTSDSDPGVSAMANLTTIANALYGLEMATDMTAVSAEPDETVIYTIYLTNTGNTADTFSIELSGYFWDSNLSANILILEVGDSGSVTVAVTVPGDANNGDQDMVTVTATSGGDNIVSDMVDLTTTAVVEDDPIIPTYGLELAPATAGITTAAGDIVNYTLTLTNTGNVSDTFTFTVAGNAWTVTLPGMVTLEAGASLTVTVMVAVPADAEAGTSDTAVVAATSANDSEASATSTLTTMIEGEIEEDFTLYLPVIMKP